MDAGKGLRHPGESWCAGWFGKGIAGMYGFGKRFGMGPERIFGRGDMKFMLLELLLERPSMATR